MRDQLFIQDLCTIDNIHLVFIAYAEDIDPCENDEFCDTEEKRKALYNKLNRYELVHFCACVKAFKNGIELASDYLGNCLYNSYEEFLEIEGDIDDMKATVIEDAKQVIKGLTE